MKHHGPLFMLLLVLAGCKDSPLEPDLVQTAVPDVAGVYILNEGNYGDVEGARLSFYVPQTDTVYRSVVEISNDGTHLGSTADDFGMCGGKLYLLMSGSEKLVVLSASTHRIQMTATYAGSTPHSMLIDSARSRIYLTQLYKNSLLVVDLQSLQVQDTIAVGLNPQDMALSGGSLFVCNSGYGSDNSITVINPESRTVTATLRVGAGPTGIVATTDGALWVACSGNAFAVPAIPGRVYRVNPAAVSVTDSVLFNEPLGGSIGAGPDGYLYVIGSSTSYFGGPLHRIATATKSVTMNFVAGTYYGSGVDQATGDLYLADARDFASAGVVSVYTKEGTLRKSFLAERGPSQFLFKR